MKSSYSSDDVEILLKDITGLVQPLPASVREKKIQMGMHYSEMIPLEYKPSEKYMLAYRNALSLYAESTAKAISNMAEKIYINKGKKIVLVSLARAGLPIGILVKHYLEKFRECRVTHYSISIIRGKGIDHNAIKYILNRHEANEIQFLDGWIGKGAITRELFKELKRYPDVDPCLAVVSDPANITERYGTREDILIPSSCLNAVVTGLISRTFLRGDIISPDDFHGAVYYEELENEDLSRGFIEQIERFFSNKNCKEKTSYDWKTVSGIKVVSKIAERYDIGDINYIKPGIGETTRVLLRRIPWKILINKRYQNSPELDHIIQLASEKKVCVEISELDLGNYKTVGIIRQLADM
ncbi:MAG: cysteine protease StiP family protein [Clostridiales bacterium]|nr:cysteine protease StiP family protein [Clostridiales bacterium]